MEWCTPTKLFNSLIDVCVVVGMDQDTGLSPSSAKERNSHPNKAVHELYTTNYKPLVLAALSGETALFPKTECEIDGRPFYPLGAVVATPPAGKKKNPRTRRSMSVLPGAGKMLPVSTDLINSIPPLCLPDGGYVFDAPQDDTVHYLVLTDIEGVRTYCCCLKIYKPYMARENESIPGFYDLVYMDMENDQDAIANTGYTTCYVPLCCCIISKYPYFSVFKDCLSSMTPNLKAEPNMTRDTLMQFVSQLALVPVPPPGTLAIEFSLNGVSNLVTPAVAPGMRIVDFEVHYPFLCFSIDDVLLLISCVLTQQRLVFTSSNYALLTLIIESIFTFIQPFSWSWTYVPVLPRNLVDLVEAPGVYIMGCHTDLKDQIERVMQMHEMGDIIIANIDEGSVQKGDNVTVYSIPSRVADPFKARMRKANTLLFDLVTVHRPSFISMADLRSERTRFIKECQSVILTGTLEMMARMFSQMTTFQGEFYFDLEAFIGSKPDEDQPFYKEVCKSHAFGSFLEETPENQHYFSAMIEKVTPKSTRQGLPQLRKRSSSLNQPVTPSDLADSEPIAPHATTTLPLPPFILEALFTGGYYDDCLAEITKKIQDLDSKSSHLTGNYLYLRGMLNIARGNRVTGLEDLFSVSSRNLQLFPSSFVTKLLSELTPAEESSLQTKGCYGKARAMKIKAKEIENLGRERKQVMTSAIPSSPLGNKEFLKHVNMMQITTSAETAKKLFEVLTLNKQNGAVDPDDFSQFYESINESDREAQSIPLAGITPLDEGEFVVMVTSSVIKTDRGMGRLIATTSRLVFLADGSHKCDTIMRFEDVQDVEYYQHFVVLATGAASLKITSRIKCTPPFIACLKEDRNFWQVCLKEMIAGYMISQEFKDHLAIKQASENVIIAEALRRSDHTDLATGHVLHLSKTSIELKKLSQVTKNMLVRRIDPTPHVNESEKTTVEAMTFVPKTGEVWCGLGSSAVVVIDTKTWDCVSVIRCAKDRVSCLAPVGEDHIWVGSMDNAIYIINTQTRRADQQLHGHADFISHIVTTTEDDGSVTVWSASLEGLIIAWDPATLTTKKTIKLQNVKTLTSMLAVGKTFWCVTKAAVLVVDRDSDGSEYKTLSLSSDQDSGRSIDCMCAVSADKVWTGCDKKGRIAVWDTSTYSHVIHEVPCTGFTQMFNVQEKVWAGGRNNHIYILNAKNCCLEKTLELHEDRIRSMCLTDTSVMLTGPGSRDGRIAVWRTHMIQDIVDAPGFEVVDEDIVRAKSSRKGTKRK